MAGVLLSDVTTSWTGLAAIDRLTLRVDDRELLGEWSCGDSPRMRLARTLPCVDGEGSSLVTITVGADLITVAAGAQRKPGFDELVGIGVDRNPCCVFDLAIGARPRA